MPTETGVRRGPEVIRGPNASITRVHKVTPPESPPQRGALQSFYIADVIEPMEAKTLATLALIASAVWTIPGGADWTEARCDIYPKGSDRLEKMIPCTFGQRQGFITITREDGVTYDSRRSVTRQVTSATRRAAPSTVRAGLGAMGRSSGSKTRASTFTGTPRP